jgi:hypothetical protein
VKQIIGNEKHTPQSCAGANNAAVQSSPHSFDKDNLHSLNKSESVMCGTSFSPLGGQRGGTVGGGYGVGDGGAESDGGVDWYLFNKTELGKDHTIDLPFANFFPTDDLTGEGLELRAASRDTKSGSAKSRRGNQSFLSEESESASISSSIAELPSHATESIEHIVDSTELSSSRSNKGSSLAQQLLSPEFGKEVSKMLCTESVEEGKVTHISRDITCLIGATAHLKMDDFVNVSESNGQFETTKHVQLSLTPKSRRASGIRFVHISKLIACNMYYQPCYTLNRNTFTWGIQARPCRSSISAIFAPSLCSRKFGECSRNVQNGWARLFGFMGTD